MLPIATTRHLFFTGKGGVGKTSLACATAIALADGGARVLLVSTDPASNLDEMLGVKLGNAPAPIPGVAGLLAMNIDPDVAAEAYRVRVLAPYLHTKTEGELHTIREQLSGACTTEIAAFDEFAGLIGGADAVGYDHVVFDTAPTGHTLRLLSLPRAWTTFLDTNTRGASCLGPHSGLTMHHDRFAAALRALADPAHTTVVLVARADAGSLREADRTSGELRALGLANQQLVINAVFHAHAKEDPLAAAIEHKGQLALEQLPDGLRALPRVEIPLRADDMVGLPALRALVSDEPTHHTALPPELATPEPLGLPSLAALLDEVGGDHALVMVMGKGGVGKTTIAAAVAVELAARGHAVHLSTTDPAAHLAPTVLAAVDHLQVSRIDPVAETRAYTDRVIARKGASLDADGRALLEEDLRSPCTEEVAVFHAFAKLVSDAARGVVVLDTAPTGHTLLLLDATGAYHRDVLRGLAPSGPSRLITPLMRLQDPGYTKILIVTLAEPTPVTEAAQLQADLRRAGIEPFAWVINATLATSSTTDPILHERIARERVQIARVRRDFARRIAIVPWRPEPPIGAHRLRELAAATAE